MNKYERLLFKIANQFFPSGPHGDRSRGRIYERFFVSCGQSFKIADGAFIYSPELLNVGHHVYVGFCSYLGNGPIHLANEVLIGNHVSITAANHLRKKSSFRFGGSKQDPVSIGAGTWIAAHSCVTAGVSIGKGCLVAAGSVVTQSFGDNLLIAGVPARIKKRFEERD